MAVWCYVDSLVYFYILDPPSFQNDSKILHFYALDCSLGFTYVEICNKFNEWWDQLERDPYVLVKKSYSMSEDWTHHSSVVPVIYNETVRITKFIYTRYGTVILFFTKFSYSKLLSKYLVYFLSLIRILLNCNSK